MAPAPRVAYLVSSEATPEQVTRLAAVLRAGGPRGVIAVRHDAGGGALDPRRLRELDVDLLETSSVERGSAAELMMVLRCIRRLLESSRFDWLVLISGSDYPVRPIDEIEAGLAGTDSDALIETHLCEAPVTRLGAPVDEHELRYHYRWSGPRQARPLARTLAGALYPKFAVRATPAGVRLGVPAKRSPFKALKRKLLVTPIRHNPLSAVAAERAPFGAGLECRYGPCSFALSHRAVSVIDAAVRQHPELVLYYRDTLVPAESYIHTVLANDPSISLVDDNRHLELSDAVDVDVDVDAVLGSGADFAGPFDVRRDAAALDAIDARVHAPSRHGDDALS